MTRGMVVCPRCNGSGEGDGDMRPLCPECDGTGELAAWEAAMLRGDERLRRAREHAALDIAAGKGALGDIRALGGRDGR